MCGIVGYIGERECKDILLQGLDKLEYRGYDSAGIALLNDNGIFEYKDKGRIANLRKVMEDSNNGIVGIGHTRWATHGEPSKVNAHPHSSPSGRFTVVHNGVIENYEQLQIEYLHLEKFKSDTDTEVVVHLIEKFSATLPVEQAFVKTLKLIKGSYAIALIDVTKKDTIYVAKNKSPLLVGMAEHGNVVSSDAMAMLHVTKIFTELNDEEIVILTRENIKIKNFNGDTIEREPFNCELDTDDIEKGTYDFYMHKEIDEQPLVIRNIIQKYQDEEKGTILIDNDVRKSLLEADRLFIIACGTSYNAGLVGKQLFEKIAQIPVEVFVASEFSYNMPLLSKQPVFIFISQSGETADSRAVLVQVKKLGYKSITMTNVPGSTLSREADFTLLIHAGPEIAVASTKAYTAQISVLSLLAVDIARAKEIKVDFDPVRELSVVANAIQSLCGQKQQFKGIVDKFLKNTPNCFFIGRGIDYYVCLEGALKLKEISYIQAEGFAGGELKHGTLALVEEDTPLIVLTTQSNVNLSIRGNAQEVKARGGNVCIISMDGLQDQKDEFFIPSVHELLTPLVSVVPFQLIAYFAALDRNCDVDKPRNLAKSVTVE